MNNSDNHSTRIWFFGVLPIPIITAVYSYYMKEPSLHSSQYFLEIIMVVGALVAVVSIFFHTVAVLGNKHLFKKIENESLLKIYITATVLVTAMPLLVIIILTNSLLTQNAHIIIAMYILMNFMVVRILKIERELVEIEQPDYPDILDDSTNNF